VGGVVVIRVRLRRGHWLVEHFHHVPFGRLIGISDLRIAIVIAVAERRTSVSD